jgi:hypothetical protein
MDFKQLPVPYTESGALRRVGFELEYTNLGIDESARLVQQLYGGDIVKEHRFAQQVVGTRLGDFGLEFDLTLLTEKKYKQLFDKLDINLQEIKVGERTLEDTVETALESVVGKIFPYEISTPPVPCTELAELEPLRQALFEHKAKGTEAFPTNAFGTHINAELPATDAATILRYLRAIVLLHPWLLEAGNTDLARRLSPFIDPYPEEYAELILAAQYEPELEQLIDDYHRYNPDRNRPLDMYPLFAALRPEQINGYSDVGKVKPRPTFHYRLPNSSVSEPGWTLAQEWNHWVVLEELANDPDRIAYMSVEYLHLRRDMLVGFESKWAKCTAQWLS